MSNPNSISPAVTLDLAAFLPVLCDANYLDQDDDGSQQPWDTNLDPQVAAEFDRVGKGLAAAQLDDAGHLVCASRQATLTLTDDEEPEILIEWENDKGETFAFSVEADAMLQRLLKDKPAVAATFISNRFQMACAAGKEPQINHALIKALALSADTKSKYGANLELRANPATGIFEAEVSGRWRSIDLSAVFPNQLNDEPETESMADYVVGIRGARYSLTPDGNDIFACLHPVRRDAVLAIANSILEGYGFDPIDQAKARAY